MKKSIAFVVGVGLIGSFVLSAGANAAQVLTPKKAGVDISTVVTPGGVSLPAGTILPIDMVYSIVNAAGQTQTKDESGLGLKVQYDSTKFDPVVVYDVNGVQTSTSISNLNTKCMIASPSDQAVSGNTREVVFGWIDTSIRGSGAVGWLGTVDPAAPGAANGCLNPGTPGIVTESGAFDAVTSPVTLFRIGLKSKTTFDGSAGNVSTNVAITTAGNISYANANNVDTNKTILVNAAAAPTTLTLAATNAVVSRKMHGALGPFDIPIDTTVALSGAVTVEPRNDTLQPHRIVYTFTNAPAAVGNTVALTDAGGAPIVGVTATTSVLGNSVIVELTGIGLNRRLNVSLDNAGGLGGSFVVPIGFLVGDIAGSARVVSVGDINAVRAVSGFATDSTNFKADINANGSISVGDINAVRSQSGLVLNP